MYSDSELARYNVIKWKNLQVVILLDKNLHIIYSIYVDN
jgi:hypothetical protein